MTQTQHVIAWIVVLILFPGIFPLFLGYKLTGYKNIRTFFNFKTFDQIDEEERAKRKAKTNI